MRLYPTKEQQDMIEKHINACRFIWNYMIELQNNRYANGEKFIRAFDMIKLLPSIKKQEQYSWLNSVSRGSLATRCRDLERAYIRYFEKKSNRPSFKSKKKSKKSFPVRCDRLRFNERYVHVSKIGKIRYKSDYDFLVGNYYTYYNARIIIRNNKYLLVFSIECENQAFELSDKPMGIDLGIKELAVVAYGDEHIVFHNINKSKKMKSIERQIKHTQRSISRKYDMSKKCTGKYEKTNNIKREEKKLRKLYARQKNIRINYLHQTTHKLVSMLPYVITMENLNVSGMIKNKHLRRSILNQCFYEFIHQMKYKSEMRGIEFIQVDRFYPSSKTCSCCGAVKKDLKLSDRTYVCLDCGLVIDRDYNAAINLMKYGTH